MIPHRIKPIGDALTEDVAGFARRYPAWADLLERARPPLIAFGFADRSAPLPVLVVCARIDEATDALREVRKLGVIETWDTYSWFGVDVARAPRSEVSVALVDGWLVCSDDRGMTHFIDHVRGNRPALTDAPRFLRRTPALRLLHERGPRRRRRPALLDRGHRYVALSRRVVGLGPCARWRRDRRRPGARPRRRSVTEETSESATRSTTRVDGSWIAVAEVLDDQEQRRGGLVQGEASSIATMSKPSDAPRRAMPSMQSAASTGPVPAWRYDDSHSTSNAASPRSASARSVAT